MIQVLHGDHFPAGVFLELPERPFDHEAAGLGVAEAELPRFPLTFLKRPILGVLGEEFLVIVDDAPKRVIRRHTERTPQPIVPRQRLEVLLHAFVTHRVWISRRAVFVPDAPREDAWPVGLVEGDTQVRR